MTYDYYIQANGGRDGSLRRYPSDSDSGDRWEASTGKWTPHCAPRTACELTKDEKVTKVIAAGYFPETFDK